MKDFFDQRRVVKMNGFEVRYNDRVFIVPAKPVTTILIYQRYGYYYIDLEGWELKSSENLIIKERFNLRLASNETIQVEMKTIEPTIASKLINKGPEKLKPSALSEEDIQQMIAKFYALNKLLKKEGLIE